MQSVPTPQAVTNVTVQPAQAVQAAPAQGVGGPQGGPEFTGTKVVRVTPGATANQIYEALRNQRSELRNQLERLEEQREDLARQLNDAATPGADKKGLEQRITFADQRIAETEKLLAEADKAVANQAAQPGAVLPPRPPPRQEGPPEEFWVLGGVGLMVSMFIMSIGFARRLWKKAAGTSTGIPAEVYDRFNKLDHAVDAIAIEVERVGEGQRYLTRMQADQARAISAGAAQRVEVAEREQESVRK